MRRQLALILGLATRASFSDICSPGVGVCTRLLAAFLMLQSRMFYCLSYLALAFHDGQRLWLE